MFFMTFGISSYNLLQREQEKEQEQRRREVEGVGDLLAALARRPDLCFHIGDILGSESWNLSLLKP